MDKQNVTKFFKGLKSGATKHSPEILTAFGVVGFITTTILAVKATPKALELIDEKKEELDLKPNEKLTAVETVQAAWKPYIPVVATGAFATGCLIAANSVHAKRYAGLATAYQISTTALNEYREKVVETIGEKKERAVHTKIAEDRVKETQPTVTRAYNTGIGNTLCLDLLSKHEFISDIDKIKRVMNDLNYRMTAGMEMCISLNEFYQGIGIPTMPYGEKMGWRVDEGLIDIHFDSFVTDKDVPCVTIEFLNPPVYGFNKLYG